MIGIVEFLDRLTSLTKKNMSAFGSGQEVSGFINMAQLELAQYLFSIYPINNNAEDLAAPLTFPFVGLSSSTGLLSYPTEHNHLLSLSYIPSAGVFKKCQKIDVSQLGIIEKLPQRRPSLEKGKILYSIQNDGIQVYPSMELSFKGIYAKYPPNASISYTYTDVNGEPKRTVSAFTDLVWNKNVYNLLLYMVMDKMGLGSRDMILNEYARLGIAREEVKPLN